MVRSDSGILEMNTNNTNKRKHKNKRKRWRKSNEEADGGSRQTLMVRWWQSQNADVGTQGWYAVTLAFWKGTQKAQIIYVKKQGWLMPSVMGHQIHSHFNILGKHKF